MKIDWKYPLLFGMDLKSTYRSVWLGWWLLRGLRALKISTYRFNPDCRERGDDKLHAPLFSTAN
jgi:hypothetical protein